MYGSGLACPVMPKKRNCAGKGCLAPEFPWLPASSAQAAASAPGARSMHTNCSRSSHDSVTVKPSLS